MLFGAGASSNSGDIVPTSPPLGKDLYSVLKINFPQGWGRLPSSFDQAFTDNFEEGMRLIWESGDFSQNIPVLMRSMGYYFAQFSISATANNLYYKFLDSLNNDVRNVLFSTINYDLLLEYASTMKGFFVNYFSENHTITNETLIWKLHGSCNFHLATIEARGFIQYTAGVSMDGPLKAVDPIKAIEYCQTNTVLYPAMCLYMKSKPTQIGHNQILALQAKWKERVLNADKILIIGVRPYPDDKHIWEPLSHTNAKLGYVGREDAFNDWQAMYRKNKGDELIGGRWADCLSQSVDFL